MVSKPFVFLNHGPAEDDKAGDRELKSVLVLYSRTLNAERKKNNIKTYTKWIFFLQHIQF